jgi:transaldolase/glucose-6-phosphate isomerase
MDAEVDRLLGELRAVVMRRFRIATTMGYGPRYLHSTGQLHKGGPGSGLYLQLTAGPLEQLPITGQQYGFDTLAAAQAIGDYRALANLGRRVVTVDLGGDVPAGLQRLLEQL